MKSTLPEHAVEFGTKVTAISYPDGEETNKGLVVTAEVTDPKTGTVKTTTNAYDAVICTVPFGRLSMMELTGAGIHDNYAQWSAIRQLQYGPAIKIGIQFKENWWSKLGIVGGQR